jgi:hypothetical protein
VTGVAGAREKLRRAFAGVEIFLSRRPLRREAARQKHQRPETERSAQHSLTSPDAEIASSSWRAFDPALAAVIF